MDKALIVGIGLYMLLLLPMIPMGLTLLKGRGSWMVSGLNTMSKEKRARYNIKALCRFTGKLVFFIYFCLMLVGFGILLPGFGLKWLGIGLMTVGSIAALIYANTGGRFLKDKASQK